MSHRILETHDEPDLNIWYYTITIIVISYNDPYKKEKQNASPQIWKLIYMLNIYMVEFLTIGKLMYMVDGQFLYSSTP